MRGLVFLSLLLVSLVPAVAAQAHEHGTGARLVILEESYASHLAFVGQAVHFTVLDLGDDNVPAFHEQNHVRVSLNGVTLYETTADSGHDYDGVVGFDVVFPAPGTYSVFAQNDRGAAWANGTVLPQQPPTRPVRAVEIPATAAAGVPMAIEFASPEGASPYPGEAVVEVRSGEALMFRTHWLGTEGTVEYAFPQPGTYDVQVVSQPFLDYGLPTVTRQTVTVSAPGVPQAALVRPAAHGSLNAVAKGSGDDGLLLLGTFDPYTVVGTNTQQHLSVLAVDPGTGIPFNNVAFSYVVTGPAAQVVARSTTLESDGILDLTLMSPMPGLHNLHVEAVGPAGMRADLATSYEVAPPVVAVPGVALAVGPQFLDITGLDGLKAGLPQRIQFAAHDAAGMPFAHSEIDVQVLDAKGIPLVQTKLHTHDDGLFAWNLTLPSAGDYTMRLSPFPLMPQPAGPFYGAELGDPLTFNFKVADGPGFPALPPAPMEVVESVTQPTPAAPAALVLVALGLVAAMVGRRIRA